MHGVRGVEQERLSPVTAEDEEDLEQELVAAVAEDEPIGLGPPPRREDLAELIATPGVPVEKDAVQLLGGDVPARHVRLGPLVRVDAHVRLEHLGPVGLELRELRSRPRHLPIAHPSIA